MYEGEENDEEKRTQSRTEEDEMIHLINTIPFQNLQKMRFKMPSTASKKEKQKTAVEYELNSSENVMTERKKKSGRSSMKLHDKKTSHRKVGARSEFKSSTKKVTEKMQAITGHFAACQCFLNRLPQYYIDDKIQPPDQGGLRPNHRTEDHLMVYRVLEQRCREWGVPLYISTIDFTKAFDRIKHSALWSSLQFYGVEPAYVRLLQRLYSQQEGTVLTDKESDVFPIKRETKQGDPLSSLLFNTVLQFYLEAI